MYTFLNHDFGTDTFDDLRNDLTKKFEAVHPKDLCYSLKKITYSFQDTGMIEGAEKWMSEITEIEVNPDTIRKTGPGPEANMINYMYSSMMYYFKGCTSN